MARLFTVAFTVAALSQLIGLAPPARAAEPGEEELKAAVVLLDDNQVRAKEQLAKGHLDVIATTRIEMNRSGGGVRFDPDKPEFDYMNNDGPGERLAKHCLGQLAVVRSLLKAGLAAAADPELTRAGATLEAMADAQDAYLVKASERASWDLSFERVFRELEAHQKTYDQARAQVPFRLRTVVGASKIVLDYEENIQIAARRAVVNFARNNVGQGDESVVENEISQEEYLDKKKKWDERKAEEKARELQLRDRLAAAEAKRQEEAERNKKQGVQPGIAPPPTPPPADQDAIAAWHKKTYVPTMMRFKAALGRMLVVDRKRRSNQLSSACNDVHSELETLISKPEKLAISPPIDKPLTGALRLFSDAALLCIGNDLPGFNKRFGEAEKQLGQLAAVLAPYKLKP